MATYYPQPYPQQQQQHQYAQGVPALGLSYSRAWNITKIVFISFSMVCCIVVLGISIALVVDPDIESFEVVWVAPQAGIALCWSIAELITICARAGHRGIHPGAHVALHLLLWLGFGAAVGLTAYLLSFALDCDYYCQNYSYYYTYYSDTYITCQQALLGFLTLLIITHFTLFVRACVETAQRNSTATPVIMMPQQVFYPPPMGQYPAPQAMPPVQAEYPGQPAQAHLSGYYNQPKEVQNHLTGSTHLSQPSAPTPAASY